MPVTLELDPMTGVIPPPPAAATVIVSVALPVPVAFVAPKVTAVVAAALGVPEMTPVVVLITKPAGNGVAL